MVELRKRIGCQTVLAGGLAVLLASAAFAADGTSAVATKKWAISVGTSVRQIDADFRASAPLPLSDWRALAPPQHVGSGSQEFYNNREDRLEYNDGAVILSPSWSFRDGTAWFSYENASQVKALGDGWYSISFHSVGIEYSSTSIQSPMAESDSETVASPFLQATYAVAELGGGGLYLAGRYGYSTGDMSSGWADTGRQEVIEGRNYYTFSYEIDPRGIHPPPSPPFESPGDGSAWVIYDAGMYNEWWSEEAYEPSGRVSTLNSTIAEFIAKSKTDLDTSLHEFLLGVGWNYSLGSAKMNVMAGPTLNLVDWDLEHRTRWTQTGNPDFSRLISDGDSGQDFAIGASAQVGVTATLHEATGIFADFFCGYAWVDKVEVETESASAEIDASSFYAGLSFGIPF